MEPDMNVLQQLAARLKYRRGVDAFLYLTEPEVLKRAVESKPEPVTVSGDELIELRAFWEKKEAEKKGNKNSMFPY